MADDSTTNTNQVKYMPVELQDVCDYLGIDQTIIENDDNEPIKRNINRLIQFADMYIQGAVGKHYPRDDERAKQIALLVISDLYNNRELDSKNISNTTRKIITDMETQLRVEMNQDGI